MNRSIYPVGAKELNLPFYLSGIGVAEHEWHNIRPDGIEFHKIILSASGKGCLIIDGKEHIITEGYGFFIPSNYPHEYYGLDGIWETHWITFGGFACTETLQSIGFSLPTIKKLSDTSSLESIFKKMYVTLKTDRISGNLSCSALLYQYILEFYRAFSEKTYSSDSDHSRILMPVFAYIDNNLSHDISMDELCAAAGVSPQHLCRIFRNILNLRPNEYISRKRVQIAKSMLIETDMPISEIGKAVGYSECSYFGAVFKRIEGISPGEYRKRNKYK